MLSVVFEFNGTTDDAEVFLRRTHSNCRRYDQQNIFSSSITAMTMSISTIFLDVLDKPSTDSPAMAHAALREIVERAVEEARKLPGLSESADTEQTPRERRAVTDNSYEDLLATAILNKVVWIRLKS